MGSCQRSSSGESAGSLAPDRRFPRGTRWLAGTSAAAVGGSGLLSLLSLTKGSLLTGQWAWLRDLFPLDAPGIGRSAALLLGFSLILTAVHLLGHKTRALQFAVALCFLTAAFHLRRHYLDLPGAAAAVAVAVALIASRRSFHIGSARPALSLALKRAALALTVALTYGSLGFWFIEPRAFRHNFHLWEAIANTARAMLLLASPDLFPATPHAHRFLESLSLISAASFFYCAAILFRPVAYHLYNTDADRRLAARLAASHGRSGQDFFKSWPDKSFFFSANRRAFLAYRVVSNFALVLGDPVGADSEIAPTLEQFVDFCRRCGWRIGFHQVHPGWLPLYRTLGFRRMKIGDDAVVDLTGFTLQGAAMKEFRNTVTRLTRLGYRVQRLDPPPCSALLQELQDVSDDWLRFSNHRERRFALGRFDRAYVEATPVYVAFDPGGAVAAFLNLIPSYRAGLATVDLMRRRQDSVNGVMDFLFAETFLDLQRRGFSEFSLGMVPVSAALPGQVLTPEEKAVCWAMQRFPSIFRSESLRRFKAKYADHWEPRYSLYRSRWDLPRLALALKGASEIPRRVRRVA